MLWLYVVVGLAAFELGFVLGAAWFAWCRGREEEERRIRIIWLGVKTSLQTGRHIECHRRPRDFIGHVRVN